jgi:hypothetical protein
MEQSSKPNRGRKLLWGSQLIQTGLQNLWAWLGGKAWGVLVGWVTAVSGSVWASTQSFWVPEWESLAGWVFLCALLFTFLNVAIHLFQRRPPSPATAPQVPALTPPPQQPQSAGPGSVADLHRVFNAQAQCIGNALAYLKRDFLAKAQPQDYARLTSGLFAAFAIPSVLDAHHRIYPQIDQDLDQQQFTELVDRINELTAQYVLFARWLISAGELFFGRNFFDAQEYGAWHQAHESFAKEVRETRSHADLRRIAQTLPSLLDLLPKPRPSGF